MADFRPDPAPESGAETRSGGPAEELRAAMERLDGRVDWERRERRRMRPSLDPIRDVLARLGAPHERLRAVHVAGSKGKGSVAALVASALTGAGLRVARYGSPHVERMNERLAFDGVDVDDRTLGLALARALDTAEVCAREGTDGREATWFDLVTAACFLAAAERGVDWMVAECGLGGRLDSTNVLDGEVCIVTTIEREHTSVLGTELAGIAREKAGILKPGCAAVFGVPAATEAGRALDARAAELGVPVARPEGPFGTFEEANAALARLALDALGARGDTGADGRPLAADRLDADALARGRLPGRLERFAMDGVPVVVDGAHTPESVRAVLDALAARKDLPGRPIAVLGLAREKDLAGVLKALGPRVDRLVCTSVGGALHRDPEEIAGPALELGLVTETVTPPRIALSRAIALARHGWVLVVGSLYLAGEVRPGLRSHPPC